MMQPPPSRFDPKKRVVASRHWKRWQRERRNRVVLDDLVDLEQVKEVSQIDLLADKKEKNSTLSRNIAYFSERTSILVFYQVHKGEKDCEVGGVRARVLPIGALARILGVLIHLGDLTEAGGFMPGDVLTTNGPSMRFCKTEMIDSRVVETGFCSCDGNNYG